MTLVGTPAGWTRIIMQVRFSSFVYIDVDLSVYLAVGREERGGPKRKAKGERGKARDASVDYVGMF